MSCLLGDLPARLVFLFFIISFLFCSAVVLRCVFLLNCRGYEEEDARLVVLLFGRFCGPAG